MIVNKKVCKPFMTYCAKVIPLAFDESMSYYETICNIANHINNEIIPKVNETMETVFTLSNKFIELKEYVDDNMLTKDVNDLTYYTLTSDLSIVALTGNYNDLSNKPTIPDVSNFITKDVNDLTYYTLTSNLSTVATSGNYNDLSNKPTIPDVSNFITKDVNNLTYYTLTSNLSTVATSGNYNDLSNKPTIPTVPTNISAFNNDSGYITKNVNDLTNYTTTTALTTLLSGKENSIDIGSNTNGHYIKFSNGELIMYGTATNGSSGYATVTFPITLTSSTSNTLIFCSKIYASGSTVLNNYYATPQINNSTTGYIYLKDSNNNNITSSEKISWLVIGKWK